jgi:hypothetical protein
MMPSRIGLINGLTLTEMGLATIHPANWLMIAPASQDTVLKDELDAPILT